MGALIRAEQVAIYRSSAAEPVRTGAANGAAVRVSTSLAELERLTPEWRALFAESQTRSPFSDPAWQQAWMRHFTREGELHVVEVRAGDRLVCVAPFYARRSPGGVQRVRLIGMGRDRSLTELPQVLSAPGMERQVLRAVVDELMSHAHDWDWVDLSLAPDHGWFEPDWLVGPNAGGSFAVQAATYACVVMDLPDDAADLDACLKPNLRHNIRKSRNRLARAGIEWRIEVADAAGPELDAAVGNLIALHATRATQTRGLRHDNYLSDRRQAAFLRAVAPEMAAVGALSVWSFVADSRPVAGLLAFRANSELLFSVSGMEQGFWNFRPMTLLRDQCIRAAIASGCRRVNFLVGPNAGKLDWSETIEVHHDFSVVSGRLRSRALHGGYLLYRTLREYRAAAGNRL